MSLTHYYDSGGQGYEKKKKGVFDDLTSPELEGKIPPITERQEVSVIRHLIHDTIVNKNDNTQIYEFLGLI